MVGNEKSGSIGEVMAEPDEFLGNITVNLAAQVQVRRSLIELQMYLVFNSIHNSEIENSKRSRPGYD
jgi:hypothetical protein